MDHLLSMEKEFIEKNNLRKLGLKNKKFQVESFTEIRNFYLVLRDCFSQYCSLKTR